MITRTQTLHYAKRYQTVLARSLSLPSQEEGVHAARSLGGQAAALGMGAVELVRAHNRSLEAIALQRAKRRRKGDGRDLPPAAGGAFLLEALRPVEEAAERRLQQLACSLRKTNEKLVVAQQEMRREVASHWTSRRQLAQGTRHYGQLLAQSQCMQEQSRRLARKILSVQEEERKEISRELHDEVAQILAGINVKLASLKEASEVDRRSLKRRIAQTQRLVEQSVRIVHRYARELRPALLDDLGLIPALRSYIRDLPGRGGMVIRFTAFSGVEVLSNAQRTVLYRVAQEALTNVARHAHAKTATVRIRKLRNTVILDIHDDGRSFPVERVLSSSKLTRLGLLGMRERVEMAGGVFAIESTRGKGTMVRAALPMGRGRKKGRT